jgi:SAM-dependent methyltransferase
MTDGWVASAEAWIAAQGERGDYARQTVLDKPMLERIKQRRVDRALDVGCGEGRFCRTLAAEGIEVVGVDPTEAFLARARSLHPGGDYRLGRAESLDLPDGSFDLVVSYLTLIDIPDIGRAIPEMARVLRPGGRLLIANLTNLITASPDMGWVRGGDGERLHFRIDDYSHERSTWTEWDGIRIVNWHRPLSQYMSLLLAQGLILRHFDEPQPEGGDSARAALYRRVPWFVIMEWEKPG